MRSRSIIIFLTSIALTAPAIAAERVIEESFPAAGVERLHIENGVGDIEFAAADDEVIHIEITLTPRRGGVFSSMKKAEEEVATAVLRSREANGRLSVELDSDSHEPRFEANWMVTAPARLRLEVELGVGDVSVAGVMGGTGLEVGVGDASIGVLGGDVEVSIGVGSGTVRAPAAAYRSASASGGVGGASIDAEGEISTEKGFVGHSCTWRGDGPDSIELEVGVGDARVILE